MAYRNLILAVEERVATLTVNRPKVRNALDAETVEEFHHALEAVRAAGTTVLIVTGVGDKAFVSGADIASIRDRGRDDALRSINSRLMSAIEAHEAVVIAAVNGVALGGGCELCLAADLRIAAEHAVFGQPEPALGIIPGAGATQRLPRLVGLGRAKEMILTGARWDAKTALAYGLVNEVVPGRPAHGGRARDGRAHPRPRPPGRAPVEDGPEPFRPAPPGRGPRLRVHGPGHHLRVEGQDGGDGGVPREAQAPVHRGVDKEGRMRNFGGIMLVLGVLGFFYCMGQRDKYPGIARGLEPERFVAAAGGKVGQWAATRAPASPGSAS